MEIWGLRWKDVYLQKGRHPVNQGKELGFWGFAAQRHATILVKALVKVRRYVHLLGPHSSSVAEKVNKKIFE